MCWKRRRRRRLRSEIEGHESPFMESKSLLLLFVIAFLEVKTVVVEVFVAIPAVIGFVVEPLGLLGRVGM